MKKSLTIILIITFLFLLSCSIEPKYTAEEWKKIQTTETTTKTPSEKDIEKFNEDIKEFGNFLLYYNNLKKEYEDEWLKILNINSRKRTFDEIYILTENETNAIKQVLAFPEFMSKYIEYDLLYTQARGLVHKTLAFLGENVENIDLARDYPDFSQDVDNMSKYLEQRENELRNIVIDFNNRAKELDLKIPFPNP